MSTFTSRSKSVKITSHYVQAGKRSYFFDLKKAPLGELYFTISQLIPEGNTWTRSTMLIPAEHARAFYDGLCATIKEMRRTESESIPEQIPVKPARRKNTKEPVAIHAA